MYASQHADDGKRDSDKRKDDHDHGVARNDPRKSDHEHAEGMAAWHGLTVAVLAYEWFYIERFVGAWLIDDVACECDKTE